MLITELFYFLHIIDGHKLYSVAAELVLKHVPEIQYWFWLLLIWLIIIITVIILIILIICCEIYLAAWE